LAEHEFYGMKFYGMNAVNNGLKRDPSVKLICFCHRPAGAAQGFWTVETSGVDFDEYEAVRFGRLACIIAFNFFSRLHTLIFSSTGFSFPISSSFGLEPRLVIVEIPHHFFHFLVRDSITSTFKFHDVVFKNPIQRFCYINIIVFHNNLL